MSCKVALLRMERAGLLVLPPPRARNGNGKKQLLAQNLLAFEQTPLTLPAHQLHPLSLVLARTRPERLFYRQIMVQHHYLTRQRALPLILRHGALGAEGLTLLSQGRPPGKIRSFQSVS
jgi:hypothetical protein